MFLIQGLLVHFYQINLINNSKLAQSKPTLPDTSIPQCKYHKYSHFLPPPFGYIPELKKILIMKHFVSTLFPQK